MPVLARRALAVCTFAFALATAERTFAQLITISPLGEQEFVRDELGLLDADALQTLEDLRDDLLDEHHTRLVVATIKSVDDYADKPIPVEYFAALLFEKWFKVSDTDAASDGDGNALRGILVLVVGQENRVYIETDPAWQRKGFLRSLDIVNTVILPHFDKGAYAEGIIAGIDSLIGAIPSLEEVPPRVIPWAALMRGAIIALCGGLIVAYLVSRSFRNVSLHDAARKGNWEGLEKALRRGKLDPNLKDESGVTPIFYAVEFGHAKSVQVLLDSGAVAARIAKEADSPLAQAINRRHLPIVAMLINRGDAVTSKFDDGMSPLMLAAKNGQEEIVELLFYEGVDIARTDNLGRTAIFFAIEAQDERSISFLLLHGADVDHRSKTMRTPLMYAIELNYRGVADLLLEAGADVNAVTSKGLSSLMLAARQGELELVRTLLDAGADPILGAVLDPPDEDPFSAGSENETDNASRQSPQAAAENSGHTEVAELIRRYEARYIKERDIHRAVRVGARETVREIIAAAPHCVNLKEESSAATPLNLAVEAGDIEMAKLLLREAADLDSRNGKRLTPLMLAVIDKNESVAELLLNAGADVSMTIKVRDLPHKISRNPELKAKTKLTAAQIATAMDQSQILQLFKIQEETQKAYEEFVHAVSNSDMAEATRIVDANPAVMDCNRPSHERTPLVIAIRIRDFDAVKFLLDNGEDPDQRNSNGKPPIHFAIIEPNEAIVKLLIDRGADCEKLYKGMTPLTKATMFSSIEVIAAILSNGADVNRPNKMGKTAIRFAIDRGDIDIVRTLLEHGANFNDRFKDRTPLDRAALRGNREMVSVLIEYGAEINATNKNGKTAAHHAAGKGRLDVLRVLIDSGADLSIEYRGQTPSDRAESNGHEKAVELMRNCRAPRNS